MKLTWLELPSQTERLRQLDFLRLLAALAVIIFHAAETIKSSTSGVTLFLQYYRPVLAILFFGFFWGSGFFISIMLLNEQRRFGHINIIRYLYRRILRTWPLYFSILLIYLGLYWDDVFFRDNIWKYLLFIQNFTHNPVYFDSWSVAIEEQFYVGILIFALLLKFRFWLVGIFILLCLTIMGRYYMGFHYSPFGSNNTLLWLDGLLIGCFAARLKADNHPVLVFLFKHANLISIISGIAFFYFWLNSFKFHVFGQFVYPFLSFLAFFPVLSKSHFLNKLFDRPSFTSLANLTYSLYLSQGLYLKTVAEFKPLLVDIFGHVPGIFAYFTLVMIVGFLISTVLFLLIEKPIFLIRERFF